MIDFFKRWARSLALLAVVVIGLAAWGLVATSRVYFPLIMTPTVGVSATTPAASLTPVPTLAPGQPVALSVNGGTKYQTIDGFGVNINGMIWDNGQITPALDALSSTLGATIFRVIIDEADWETANDNADPSTFNWAVYNQIYASPKFASLWKTLRYMEAKPNSKVILNVMGRVPQWMGRTSINVAQEDEWAEMVTSLVVYARQHEGLKISLFSPINEMDLGDPEGPAVNAAQTARLLSKVAARLRALGLTDTKLIVPENAFTEQVPAYLAEIMDDTTLMQQVAYAGFHDYGGTIENIEAYMAGSPYPALHYWLNEYSHWCEGCLSAATESESWALATDTSDYLFNYLEHGASAALLWEGLDSYYNHHGEFQYWGIAGYERTTGEFSPRHRFYTSAQIFRFVRPGMVRVATTSGSASLRTLAFVNSATGAITIVGRNSSGASATIDGTLAGLPAQTKLTLGWTTQQQRLAYAGTVPVSGNRFSATVPADSVFVVSTFAP